MRVGCLAAAWALKPQGRKPERWAAPDGGACLKTGRAGRGLDFARYLARGGKKGARAAKGLGMPGAQAGKWQKERRAAPDIREIPRSAPGSLLHAC